jgi:hypothetical protein
LFLCRYVRSPIIHPLLKRNMTSMISHRNLLMRSSRCGLPSIHAFYGHWIYNIDSCCSSKFQLICSELSQENQDLLIRCIAQHLGYAGNRPVAACIIYKCLLHWRSFEVERTSVFDRIIQTIGHAIEVTIMWCNCLTIIYTDAKAS